MKKKIRTKIFNFKVNHFNYICDYIYMYIVYIADVYI